MSMWWAIEPVYPTQRTPVVDRREQLQVGRMRAAVVRVVDEHDVAGREAPVASERRRQRELHEPELGRDLLGVRDHPTLGVEETAREVEHLADDRREGRAVLDDRHLLGDAGEGVREHLLRDGIEAHRPPRSSRAVPAGPAESRQPGDTTMVESSCSTIAGPVTRAPAPRSPRS